MPAHLVVLLACALALAACSSEPATVEATATPAAAATTAACGPIEMPERQGGEHLIGDAEPPVPYSSVPPTSGWHSSGAFEIRVHTAEDPLPEPTQVSVLEAGGVVVTYHDIPDTDRAAIEELVRTNYDGRVAVTPYDKLEPGQVATTAFGILQICDGLALDTLTAFIETHAEPEVQPGH